MVIERLKNLTETLFPDSSLDVSENKETLETKKEVVQSFIEQLTTANKLGIFGLFFPDDMKDSLSNFLLGGNVFTRVINGIKWELFQSKLYDEKTAEYITMFKKRLDDSKDKESLLELKSWVIDDMNSPTLVVTQFPSSSSPPASSPAIKSNENLGDPVEDEAPSIQMDISDVNISGVDNSKYVEKILARATQYESVPYEWGGISPNGFDCSGLWYYIFEQEGIKFPSRFTASVFSETNKKISRESAQSGDFMYRKSKPGQRKHNDIYHIEMLIDTPYFENGKWYVKTFGSSTDKGVYINGKQTNKSGVGFRMREITNYRYFGRPTYFSQLAQHEKTGDESTLIASIKPATSLDERMVA